MKIRIIKVKGHIKKTGSKVIQIKPHVRKIIITRKTNSMPKVYKISNIGIKKTAKIVIKKNESLLKRLSQL